MSDAAGTISIVMLERPARQQTGAITTRVRRAILLAGEGLGIPPTTLLRLHGQVEYIGSPADLIADVEERYELAARSVARKVEQCLDDSARGVTVVRYGQQDVDDARCVLFALPDAEFLTVLEHAVKEGFPDYMDASMADGFIKAADGALRAHGAPYRRVAGRWLFAWVGDPRQHQLTVAPALLVLDDPRLAGARAEFEEALKKRRDGTPKDLEDAVDEAAKAVESMLQVLHDEHGVTPPRSQQLTPLFNSLVAAQGPPRLRRQARRAPRRDRATTWPATAKAPTVREVPEELAEASIAAAATAMTFLAHYLP